MTRVINLRCAPVLPLQLPLSEGAGRRLILIFRTILSPISPADDASASHDTPRRNLEYERVPTDDGSEAVPLKVRCHRANLTPRPVDDVVEVMKTRNLAS